ncbi:MAG: hypothetical protein WC712_06250 [Candidatus Brocadiia bacterium]
MKPTDIAAIVLVLCALLFVAANDTVESVVPADWTRTQIPFSVEFFQLTRPPMAIGSTGAFLVKGLPGNVFVAIVMDRPGVMIPRLDELGFGGGKPTSTKRELTDITYGFDKGGHKGVILVRELSAARTLVALFEDTEDLAAVEECTRNLRGVSNSMSPYLLFIVMTIAVVAIVLMYRMRGFHRLPRSDQ